MACYHRRRCTGISLLVLGVTTVLVGLIIAQAVPNLVRKVMRERSCVTSEDSPNYKDWINPPKQKTLLYYWNIVNSEGFLYNGETPKLEQKGPYVYTSSSKKIGVWFHDTEKVTYKTFRQQEFDELSTKEKCPSCGKNDKLSLLNSAYIAFMAQSRSDLNLCMAMLPNIIKNFLTEMDTELGGRNATLKQLGKLNSSMFPANTSTFPKGWSKFEFGSWINSQSSFSALLQDRRNFSLAEMAGLYNVLEDPLKLGIGLNESHGKQCKADPIQTTQCGLLVYLKTYDAIMNNNTVVPVGLALSDMATSVRMHLQALVCPSEDACFQITSLWQPVLEYITYHLMKLAAWSVLDSNNFGLVITRKQNEFALGYNIDELRMPPLLPNGLFVRGILSNHRDENEARASKSSLTLYTCSSKSGNEFTVAAANGESTVKQSYFPNAKPSDLKIAGYTGKVFPAMKELKACSSSYSLENKSLDLYVSQLHIKTKISHTKDVNHHGLKLQRYEPTEMININNVSVFYKGLIDLSWVYGFPMTASFPGFLYGEPSLRQVFDLAPDVEKHGSFLDVDPISGLTMHSRFRLQLNSAVLKEFVSCPRQRQLNVSYVSGGPPHSKVVPIYWVEHGGEIDKPMAEAYQAQVYGRLRNACLMKYALPFVGALMVLIGIVLIILSKKGNQVTHTPSEEPSSTQSD